MATFLQGFSYVLLTVFKVYNENESKSCNDKYTMN